MISTTVLYYNILGYSGKELKLSLSLMKLPNLQNEGRKVSESFMKFHELKLSILEVSEPYLRPLSESKSSLLIRKRILTTRPFSISAHEHTVEHSIPFRSRSYLFSRGLRHDVMYPGALPPRRRLFYGRHVGQQQHRLWPPLTSSLTS